MVKILLIAVVIAVLLGGAYYLRTYYASSTPSIVSGLTSSSEATDKERISSLENKIEVLERQVANPAIAIVSPIPKASSGASTDQRLGSLEVAAQSLQNQINLLKISGTTTQTTTTSTGKSTDYIPLGWVGGISDQNWTSVTTQEITINAADYPGYKSMQFEVNLRIYQGNGTAYARLLNNSDGTGVSNSEVSTTSENYTWVSSSTFTLPSSQKTYRMQLKSTTGYEAGVQNARIKVNY